MLTDYPASVRQFSTQTALNTAQHQVEVGKTGDQRSQEEEDLAKPEELRKISVDDSMVRKGVNSLRTSAITSIPAKDVEREDTGRQPAMLKSIKEGMYGMAPKYLRYNI